MGDPVQEETVVSQDDTHIALCVLLIEAAHVDGECSDEEIAHVIESAFEFVLVNLFVDGFK